VISDFALATFARPNGLKKLWLIAGNPVAARVYSRLGFARVVGTNCWYVNVFDGRTPEEWMADTFAKARTTPSSGESAIAVQPGSPAVRTQMVPLLHSPHDDIVLDATLKLFSTRRAVQDSCGGLFPRFAALVDERWGTGPHAPPGVDDGQYFAAFTGSTLVGLSSAVVRGPTCAVDSFIHRLWRDEWPRLIAAAEEWAAARGCTELVAVVPTEDAEKMGRFAALGFGEDTSSRPPPIELAVGIANEPQVLATAALRKPLRPAAL